MGTRQKFIAECLWNDVKEFSIKCLNELNSQVFLHQWNCFVLTFHILPQIFEGNSHYDTPEVRRFDEIVTQHIRVFPERWSPAGIGMRMEVLGCDLPGRSAHTWMIGETTHRWSKVACVDKWTIPHSSRNESWIHLHIYDKLNDLWSYLKNHTHAL